MKTFRTLTLTSDPVNLIKDVGMIPYALQKWYDTGFVSYIQGGNGRDFRDQVKSLKTECIGDDGGKNHTLNLLDRKALGYVWRNARGIDVLNLYFLKNSMVYGILYKLRNPSGTLYLKMDGNALKMEKENRGVPGFLRRAVFGWYLRHVTDKVSIESLRGFEFMKKTYRLTEKRLIYLPNGMDDSKIGEVLPWEKKDNVILNVGRIGSWEKHTEMLLEAAGKVNWHDGWKLRLVGPVAEGFEVPQMPGVELAGPIFDRDALFGEYNRARAFTLTSRFESFGLVCVEAQAFGNYLLLTPFCTAPDFTDNGKVGTIVQTADELASAMQDIIDNPEKYSGRQSEILAHSSQYYWSALSGRLRDFLESS